MGGSEESETPNGQHRSTEAIGHRASCAALSLRGRIALITGWASAKASRTSSSALKEANDVDSDDKSDEKSEKAEKADKKEAKAKPKDEAAKEA